MCGGRRSATPPSPCAAALSASRRRPARIICSSSSGQDGRRLRLGHGPACCQASRDACLAAQFRSRGRTAPRTTGRCLISPSSTTPPRHRACARWQLLTCAFSQHSAAFAGARNPDTLHASLHREPMRTSPWSCRRSGGASGCSVRRGDACVALRGRCCGF